MAFRCSIRSLVLVLFAGSSSVYSAGAALIIPQRHQRLHRSRAFVPGLHDHYHFNWWKDTLQTQAKAALAFSKQENRDATDVSAGTKHPDSPPPPLVIHHTALKTRNITTAIEFYSLLGFQVTTRFRAGPARAAWLELGVGSSSSSSPLEAGCRLELIEVPSFVLQEPEGMKRRALDLMARQELLGHNHLALDVTDQIIAAAEQQVEEDGNSSSNNLTRWIQGLNQTSIAQSNRMLRIALPPQQQMIGKSVYELAFLYDADGALVELLNKQTELEQEIKSGWEVGVDNDFDFQQQQ